MTKHSFLFFHGNITTKYFLQVTPKLTVIMSQLKTV